MRALPVVLLLLAADAALADTPTPDADADAGADADAAPATDTEEPPLRRAPPIRPPALVVPAGPPPAAPAAPASSTVPIENEERESVQTKHGYRVQIAVADGAAVLMSFVIDQIASGSERPASLATLTIASYFFTAPLIHGVHRQGKRALGSFALRAGLPLALGFLGEELDGTPKCDDCEDTLRSDGKVIGLTVGVLVAMAVDNVLLARPVTRRTERPRAAWVPALRGVRGGATAGLAGTF